MSSPGWWPSCGTPWTPAPSGSASWSRACESPGGCCGPGTQVPGPPTRPSPALGTPLRDRARRPGPAPTSEGPVVGVFSPSPLSLKALRTLGFCLLCLRREPAETPTPTPEPTPDPETNEEAPSSGKPQPPASKCCPWPVLWHAGVRRTVVTDYLYWLLQQAHPARKTSRSWSFSPRHWRRLYACEKAYLRLEKETRPPARSLDPLPLLLPQLLPHTGLLKQNSPGVPARPPGLPRASLSLGFCQRGIRPVEGEGP